MTVRRALSLLEQQGLVTGVKGRGTYARSRDLADSVFRLDSLSGRVARRVRGDTPALGLHDQSRRAGGGDARAWRPASKVIHLRRVVLSNGIPAMYHTEYIIYDPRRPLVESQLQLTSLHAFLDSGGAQRFPRGELTRDRGQARRRERSGAGGAGGRAGACAWSTSSRRATAPR